MPTTLFDAPSPSGRNEAKLYLNSKGQLFDRHGNSWGRSSIATMAQDAALKPRRKLAYDDNETSPSAERDAPRGQEDLARLRAAIKKLALATGHDDGDYQKMLDNVLGHREAGGGASATDEDADVEEQVREYLRGKGLADDDVEEAIQKVRADRKAARDSRPENAIHGGFGGRFSGRVKEPPTGRYPGIANVLDDGALAKEYPGAELVSRDNYGDRPEPPRRLKDDGVVARGSQRLAGDEDIEAQIEREYGRGPGIGMFGG